MNKGKNVFAQLLDFIGSTYTVGNIMTMAVAYWLLKDKQYNYQRLQHIVLFLPINVYLFCFLTFICVAWARMADAAGNNAA